MAIAYRGNEFIEVDEKEVDYEIPDTRSFLSLHGNLIPNPNAVQSPRIFYGSRFFDQALPIINAEAPLVRNIANEETGETFDRIAGNMTGVVRADQDATVDAVSPDEISITRADGTKKTIPLYNEFVFNRKTSISHRPQVKVGDRVTAGQIMAGNNFTDNEGNLAMGLNARVASVPYKGYSMDDAIVISEDFAKRLRSAKTYQLNKDYGNGVKSGKDHFQSLFKTEYSADQMKTIDSAGVVLPGTTLNFGDPMILATKPKVLSSNHVQMGKLSRSMQQARANDTMLWDHKDPGVVKRVVNTKKGVRLIVGSESSTEVGDKITFRSGQKDVVSKILPADRMPRTQDGEPLDVLLNHLGLPSRVNSALPIEIAMGKLAHKLGKSVDMLPYNKPDGRLYEEVLQKLKDAGLEDKEIIYDPEYDQVLENPVQVGRAYVMKLHHEAEGKGSTRGTGSYDSNNQPARGSFDGAKSKRRSGLEINGMISSGAYENLREGNTLTGEKNDEYWRALRGGKTLPVPGEPFVWDKFQALIMGAGMQARNMPGGKLRLGPMTDRELDKRKARRIDIPELVNPKNLDPIKGGLFDSDLVSTNSWGYIDLPEALPNPVYEDALMKVLGLTRNQFREVMAGRRELE